MRHDSERHHLGLLLAFVLVPLIAGSSPAASPPSSPPGAGGAPASMTGTLRAVDAKARTVEVITGVGHALRLIRMRVAPDCDIKVAGEAAPLARLKAGRVVRVEYLAAPAGPKAPSPVVAQSIATFPMEGAGGAP